MDFTATQEQLDLAGLAREILTDRLSGSRLPEVGAEPDRFDRPLWKELARAGVLAAALPPSIGGDGLGLQGQCAVLVELGRAVAPVPYLAAIVAGASTLARFGDDVQRQSWAAPAAQGELMLTAALTDESTVRAQRVGGGWQFSGVKTTVPAAPFADLILLPALTDAGPAVFLLLPADDGVQVQRQYVVDGACHGRLELDGLTLPDARLLGGVESGLQTGAEASQRLIEHATVGLCALQLGVTERALELTSEYARNRVQFSRPIGSFQAVAQRLADAYVDVEAIRWTMWQAAWRLDQGLPCPTEIATAKFWAADAGHRVAHTAVHVHGGTGIDLDYPLHRYFTAASHYEFSLGGAADHVRRIGATLAADV